MAAFSVLHRMAAQFKSRLFSKPPKQAPKPGMSKMVNKDKAKI